MKNSYVHGYDVRENTRLQDQASTLVELLHSDTRFPAGSTVLEAGCGVGAQTVTLAKYSPDAIITSIDISQASVDAAQKAVKAAGFTNVSFQQGDIFHLPFTPDSFDHIFVCFVLEHLSLPVEALSRLKRILKPGGSITVIEGDHGSAYFYPDNVSGQKGDSMPGRTATKGRRQRQYRKRAVSASHESGIRRGQRFSANGLCRFQQAGAG